VSTFQIYWKILTWKFLTWNNFVYWTSDFKCLWIPIFFLRSFSYVNVWLSTLKNWYNKSKGEREKNCVHRKRRKMDEILCAESYQKVCKPPREIVGRLCINLWDHDWTNVQQIIEFVCLNSSLSMKVEISGHLLKRNLITFEN
jgi:hypothetical protein